MFGSDSPAELGKMRLPAPLVSPANFAQAVMSATHHLGQTPVIFLHQGEKIAVIPRAFAAGSKAVLVDSQGAVASRILTADAVAELQRHLADGDVGSAHRTLFDGVKPAASGVVDLLAWPSGKNNRLAAKVAAKLESIKELSRYNTLEDVKKRSPRSVKSRADHFAPAPLYDAPLVNHSIDASSAQIRNLIIAGQFEAAADIARLLICDDYYREGEALPNFSAFYGKNDVDFIIEEIINLIHFRAP